MIGVIVFFLSFFLNWHGLWLFMGVIFLDSYDYNLLSITFSNFCLGLKMGILVFDFLL